MNSNSVSKASKTSWYPTMVQSAQQLPKRGKDQLPCFSTRRSSYLVNTKATAALAELVLLHLAGCLRCAADALCEFTSGCASAAQLHALGNGWTLLSKPIPCPKSLRRRATNLQYIILLYTSVYTVLLWRAQNHLEIFKFCSVTLSITACNLVAVGSILFLTIG